MKDINKVWDITKYPPHTYGDVLRHNKNVEDKKELCTHCEGTGNEFFSMYRKCPKCKGTGIKKARKVKA